MKTVLFCYTSCPPSMDPKKKSMIYVVTASLLVIRKLSEQAVSKGSGGEKIL